MPAGRCEVCGKWSPVLHRHHWFCKRWNRTMTKEPKNIVDVCPYCHLKDDTNAAEAAELKAACLAVVAQREGMEPEKLVEELTYKKWHG